MSWQRSHHWNKNREWLLRPLIRQTLIFSICLRGINYQNFNVIVIIYHGLGLIKDWQGWISTSTQFLHRLTEFVLKCKLSSTMTIAHRLSFDVTWFLLNSDNSSHLSFEVIWFLLYSVKDYSYKYSICNKIWSSVLIELVFLCIFPSLSVCLRSIFHIQYNTEIGFIAVTLNGWQFDMLMHPNKIANWLDFRCGLLIFLIFGGILT